MASTLVIDVPDGLRCDDVYYGPVIPTHDVYTWDAVTLTGTLQSTFAEGCDNAPGGTLTYPSGSCAALSPPRRLRSAAGAHPSREIDDLAGAPEISTRTTARRLALKDAWTRLRWARGA